MSREWPGVARKEWARADVRRREDTDYDPGTATIQKASEIAALATGALTIPPTDAQYVVLAANSTLSAERVLTAGSGITLTDAGAGGALTVATTDVWVVKASDTSRSSTTSYADDPDLTFAVATGTYYVNLRMLALSSSATPDIKVQFTYPASSSVTGWYIDSTGTAAELIEDSTSPAGGIAFPMSGGTRQVLSFDLMVKIGAAGSFTVQWAQDSSSATATVVESGSFLRYRKTV